MTSHSIGLSDTVQDYLIANSVRETPLQRQLRDETASALGGAASMQIAPEQGQFMALMARLIGARLTLEIGTFTGYSALAVAQALPSDGRLVACDINADWTAIGRRYWAEAGVADRIDLRLGPAIETLAALRTSADAGKFDLAFIDADKTNYGRYFEDCLALLRPGGLIMIDNVLWGGSVADTSNSDADTAAIRQLNAALHTDQRIDLSLVPIGDGLTLARKR
jgi:predicted O-methyltransferase YrrM